MSDLQEVVKLNEEKNPDESEEDEKPSEEAFPALHFVRTNQIQQQAEKNATVLFKPPKPSRSRRVSMEVQQKAKSGISKLRKKSLDDMLAEFSSRRKKRDEKLSPFRRDGSGSLSRSFSWDTLRRVGLLKESFPEEKDQTDSETKTFVYVPPTRAARQTRTSRSVTPTPETRENEAIMSSEDASTRLIQTEPSPSQQTDSPPGKMPGADTSESTSVSMVARRKKSKQLDQIVHSRLVSNVSPGTKRKTFTDLDLSTTQMTQQQTETTKAINLNEGVGMLRVKVLAVSVPQKLEARRHADLDEDSGQSGDEEGHVCPSDKAVPPTDGLFCILSINGKHSRMESSLQPLDTRKQLALWDSSESEGVFYVSPSQQVFITSRKMPLADVHDNQNIPLFRHPRAECVGVGILPVSQLTQKSINTKDELLDNWTEIETKHSETTIILEPQGSVLLGLSYFTFSPKTKVTCTGSVIIQSISGVDCSWNGELCLIGCTLDIDSTNYGTTGNVLGLDDIIADGWSQDPIDFESNNSYLCRVNIWGFATDETEHCFGESCIPLAAILPYSKQIVHQENEKGPLQLLERYERQLTVPIEPRGSMKVQFSLSPLHDESEENYGDELMMSTPQHRNLMQETSYHPEFEHSMEVPRAASIAQPVPVTNGLAPASLTTSSVHSIAYDHLMPLNMGRSPSRRRMFTRSHAPSITDSKLLTWRFLGSTKLQVPKNYHEKTFMMLTDTYDPSKEIEILKDQLRDVNSKLAESEFYREKAELQVKTLKEEVDRWKKKYKKKHKK